MQYRTTIATSGKTATGIPVPEHVLAALGGGKRPAVTLTLNGAYTYRSTVGTVDGRPMVGLSAEHRARSGIEGGDEVEVEIELDTAPREVAIPEDFSAALDAEPAARDTFNTLSYSNRSYHVLSIEGARTEETRQRRIAKAVEALKAGRPR